MSKLLVLGVCPLPFESVTRSFGPGTRTWQLVEPLINDGHEVTLVALRTPGTYPDDTPEEVIHRDGCFNYASIPHEAFCETQYINNVYRDMKPDAVIFAHGSASYFEHLLEPDVPVWIDLCGHVMAEAQANARMALMLAMGELQKSMGPDQRVSANGEILSDPTSKTTTVSHPHWTGVWNSWQAGDSDSSTNPDTESEHRTLAGASNTGMHPTYKDDREDHFRSWLVSLDPAEAAKVSSAIDLTLDGSVMPDNNIAGS